MGWEEEELRPVGKVADDEGPLISAVVEAVVETGRSLSVGVKGEDPGDISGIEVSNVDGLGSSPPVLERVPIERGEGKKAVHYSGTSL